MSIPSSSVDVATIAGGGAAALNRFAYEAGDGGWQTPPLASKMRGIRLRQGRIEEAEAALLAAADIAEKRTEFGGNAEQFPGFPGDHIVVLLQCNRFCPLELLVQRLSLTDDDDAFSETGQCT